MARARDPTRASEHARVRARHAAALSYPHMPEDIQQSLAASLAQVTREREIRACDKVLQAAVDAVKTYQQARFLRTYADLSASPRYERAVRFFVNDLYGPMDFTRRDIEFARVAPGIVRLFPRELSKTVADIAFLHALSERLDTQLARHVTLAAGPLPDAAYAQAWRLTGQPAGRRMQIDLVLELGRSLDRLTRHVLLRQALKAMRLPARRAGLGELQAFLEEGFDAFHAMRGASEFLAIVDRRESEFAATMFAEQFPVNS